MIQKNVKIFGKTIILTIRNDGDFSVASELFLDHQYRFCDKIIQSAKNTIIDIGGHLGFFSIYASLLNSTIPIYAFEPHEGNYQLLKTNLKKNRIRNVIPKNLAVDKKLGQTTLYISKEDLNHSIVKAIEATNETQLIQTTTLERIFEKNRINQCDLIKMDCEGSEFDILYNTPQSIFDKTSNIFLEYHEQIEGHDNNKLKDFLKKAGYKVEKYPNEKKKYLGFLWCTK